MRYIDELAEKLDQSGHWIYEEGDTRPFREKVKDWQRQIKAGRQPGAPVISETDEAGDMSFEEWYIRCRPEGQRLAARYLAAQPTEEQSKTLAIFLTNVRQRMRKNV